MSFRTLEAKAHANNPPPQEQGDAWIRCVGLWITILATDLSRNLRTRKLLDSVV